MKRKLYVVTLEPIEQRYTKQWYNYWKESFSKFFKVEYIDGYPDGVEIKDTIENGRFLDINMTNVWKAEQVKRISLLFAEKKIKNNDVFIFMDAWHFGITAVKYMSQLGNINCKLYGYWHAGTYDPNDFTAQAGLGEWASYDEIAWLRALDGSFVATQFHKDLICNKYKDCIKSKSIHVVGFPMDWTRYIQKELGIDIKKVIKSNIVVFPHRLDKEKRPEVFDNLGKQLKEFNFIKTLDVTKNKKDYYELLAISKVVFSASKQETFGIGTVEAMMLGCIPVVPNELSYKEMYDDQFKYANGTSAKSKLIYAMHHHGEDNHMMKVLEENKHKIQKQSLNAVPNMAKIMLRK